MKKQLRKIVVTDSTYQWLVSPIDPNFVSLKIWHPNNSAEPWAVVRYQFDDPWLHYGELVQARSEEQTTHFQLSPIRPSTVADIIQKILQVAPLSYNSALETQYFEYDPRGTLTPLPI